jgi:hypothetical protein
MQTMQCILIRIFDLGIIKYNLNTVFKREFISMIRIDGAQHARGHAYAHGS